MSTAPTSPDPSGHGPRPPERRHAEPLLSRSPRRWVRLLPYLIALGFVAVLLPVTAQVLSHDYGVNGAVAGLLGVAQAAPLLLAVSRPLLAWWIIITADIVGAVVVIMASPVDRPVPWTPMVIVGYLVLCLALSLRQRRRTLVGIWLVTVAASIVLGGRVSSGQDNTAVLLIVLSGVVLLLGSLLRERGEQQRKLVEQETISEAERARSTLLEERARIARELHDVVAHHMSLITVQADSAPYRLGELPEEARQEFASIAKSARESLSEMRRLLSVLRSDGTDGERAPQPGLDRLQQLVEATVRAGVPVGLSVPELALVKDLARVSPAVDLSAYRIVQEALANVVRHAPGARTEVSVTTDGDHLMVLVVNGPADEPVTPLESGSTGHGLVGMSERVRLIGGTLDVGPLPDGGFRVAARMPVVEPGGTAAPRSATPFSAKDSGSV